MKRKLLWLGFGLYTALMLWLLFGQRLGSLAVTDYRTQLQWNLQPYATMRRFWWVVENSENSAALRHAVVNLAGNVVMFVPLGLFLPLLFVGCRRFWRFLLWVLLVIVLVELIQLVTLLGTCDVDDLILNLAGVLMGYLSWVIAWREP